MRSKEDEAVSATVLPDDYVEHGNVEVLRSRRSVWDASRYPTGNRRIVMSI